MTRFLTITALILNASASHAQDWSGHGELGYTETQGNTETTSLNAKASLSRAAELHHWNHEYKLETLRQTETNTVTAERYLADARWGYQFTERAYAFGKARYDKDQFSGFDYSASTTFGIGKQFIKSDKTLLDMAAGPGYRVRQLDSSPYTKEEDGIIMGSLNFKTHLSESSEFLQDLLVESGNSNTFAESNTGLKSNIRGNLAMKINYNLKYNSDVPADVEHTDRTTSVTLVYDFL